MKKYLFLTFGLVVLALGCTGAAFLGNPDPMAVSCTTNFTRTVPHFCSNTAIGTGVVLTGGGACQSLDLAANYGVQSTTSAASYGIQTIVASQNAIADRQISLSFFNAAGCAGGNQIYPGMITSAREEVAVAGNVNLLRNWQGDILLRNGSNAGVPTIWYVLTFTNCATACQAQLNLRGYYD